LPKVFEITLPRVVRLHVGGIHDAERADRRERTHLRLAHIVRPVVDPHPFACVTTRQVKLLGQGIAHVGRR
jgi:hypothetical protein